MGGSIAINIYPRVVLGMGSCFWVGRELIDGCSNEEMSIMMGHEME